MKAHSALCLFPKRSTGVFAKPAARGVRLAKDRGGGRCVAASTPNAFAPTEHIWVAEKDRLGETGGGLPQYPGTILL